MNAASKKKKERTTASEAVARLLPLPNAAWRQVLIGVALIALPIGGAYWAWDRWGERITAEGDYVLRAESFQITQPPEWVQADVREEVIRDGSLEGLSLLDPQLTRKVFQAFAAHSWVENVSRVSKHPPGGTARVVIEMTYRRPVAMVEVELNGQPGLLPIDSEAILLPPHDFTTAHTRDYLRIAVPHAVPTGAVGTAWGQTEIHDAARIAAVFQEVWKKCGLYRIQLVPLGSADSTQIVPTFELQSRSGASVIWGRAPDLRNETEVKTALAKVASVVKYVEENGSLELASPDTILDVRVPHSGTRAAQQPLPYR
jgi:hypothetical protein